MITALTILTYLITHNHNAKQPLRLSARKAGDGALYLRWSSVSPETQGLAVVIKNTPKRNPHYYSVLYNLSAQAHHLTLDQTKWVVDSRDVGVNSWGTRGYHPVTGPATVTLYALDKRFSSDAAMTGEMIEKKIKGHVISCGSVKIS